MPEKRKSGDIQTIRSLMPLVLLGFALVLTALLLLLWPTGQFGEQNVQTIPHILRVVRPMIGESALNIPRRILDVAIYLVVIIGIGFLVVAWRRGTRNSLLGLIGIAILGLSYVSGMALYTGPAVGTCGFLLILFGAMVAWIISRGEDEDDEASPAETDTYTDPAERTENTTLGTDDYASHPVT